jgi:branched-chain amino acid transport system substrate-binding protein
MGIRVRAVAATIVVVATVAACDDDSAVSPTTVTFPAVTTTTTPVREEDGVLRIGLLLPQSGDGAALGTPLIDAAERARDEINAAGGVGGADVELIAEDEGTTAASAMDAIGELLDAGVDAVVGPASSNVAVAVLDDLVDARVLTCSPTATALALDDFPDRGLFFRTAPSDSLQAATIAKLAEETGALRVAVAYLDDVYGRPLANATIAALSSRGLTVTDPVPFGGSDESLVNEATLIASGEPSAIVVLADADQGIRMIDALSQTAGGLEAAEVPDIIVNDAIRRAPANLVVDLGGVVLDRLTGVSPRARPSEPNDEPIGAFATNAYDCVNLIALAAEQANQVEQGQPASTGLPDAAAMSAALEVVSARGQPCRTFFVCTQLLGDERGFDYEGPGPGVDIGPDGDPSQAWFDVFTFDATGRDVSAPSPMPVP